MFLVLKHRKTNISVTTVLAKIQKLGPKIANLKILFKRNNNVLDFNHEHRFTQIYYLKYGKISLYNVMGITRWKFKFVLENDISRNSSRSNWVF